MRHERIIPPPPPDDHGEGAILYEFPNLAGLVLWQDLRHVRDWVESPQEVRAGLYNAGCRIAAEKRTAAVRTTLSLSAPMLILEKMKAAPLSIDGETIAGACQQIVEWAQEQEAPRTAILWAEAAARADQNSPRLANLAARLNRNANRYERAEVWFSRGIGLARENDSVVEEVWGHLGYGKLFQEVGKVAEAWRHLKRGSALAWRHGPPSLAASAQHDLFFMLTVRGHLSEAAESASRALQWYPKGHHRLPFFAADAALMLVLDGCYLAAARVLRTALPLIEQPTARATILALIARAYAGAGEPEEFAVFRRRALKTLSKHRGMEPVTRWHLADAQRLACNWEEARKEAEVALEVAEALNDREIVRLTKGLLRRVAKKQCRSPRKIPRHMVRPFVMDLVDRLLQWAPRRMRQWTGPWGSTQAA